MDESESFWQVELTLPKENSAFIEEFFLKAGALGCHELLYEEGKTDNLNNDFTVQIYHYKREFPIQAFVIFALETVGNPSWKYRIFETSREDYLKSMKAHFEVSYIAPDLLLAPPWDADFKLQPGDKKLIINPSFAFGTGKHETTQLMVRFIESLRLKGGVVVDMGCGSGILALTALLYGADSAIGIDVESLSVESARENMQLNLELNPFFQSYSKSPQSAPPAQFIEGDFSFCDSPECPEEIDLFVANILPEIFYQNKAELIAFLRKSKRWALSGVYSKYGEPFQEWLLELGAVSVGPISGAPISPPKTKLVTDELDGWLLFGYNPQVLGEN